MEVLRPQKTHQFAKFYTVIIFHTFMGENLEPRSRSLRNQDSLSWCKAEPDENRLWERTRNGGERIIRSSARKEGFHWLWMRHRITQLQYYRQSRRCLKNTI